MKDYDDEAQDIKEFNKMIKEDQTKKDRKARNLELYKLYNVRVKRKRAEYEKIKAKQELRESLLRDKAYVSDNSSTIANSCDFNQEKQDYEPI